MINWLDIMVARECQQDLLRQVEKERLIRQLKTDSNKPRTWQHISDLVFGNNQKKQPARDRTQGRKRACLVKESV